MAQKIAIGILEAFGDLRRAFSDWELRGLMLFGVLIISIGICFYTVVEGWSVIEALYFCVASLTTVGYGDLHPTNDGSRLFTAAYVLIGVGFILGFVNVVARQATRPIVTRMAQHEENQQKKDS